MESFCTKAPPWLPPPLPLLPPLPPFLEEEDPPFLEEEDPLAAEEERSP